MTSDVLEYKIVDASRRLNIISIKEAGSTKSCGGHKPSLMKNITYLKHNWDIILFGIVEILIGGITLTAVLLSLIEGKSTKPLNILLFVLFTASTSLGIGIGIIKRSLVCYRLLLYFSSIIFFSKILIFAKIITVSGAIETTIPAPVKNIVSIIYHGIIIFYFIRNSVREKFIK